MSVSANAGVPHFAASYTSNLVVTSQINTLSGNLVINPSGDVDLSGKKIINAATPSGPDDGVTKSYADTTYTTAPVSTVTDNAIALYDGTTGKLLKESPITISNIGVISSSTGITVTPAVGQSLIITSDTQINGNLSVTGTTTTVNTDQMLVKDSTISLNNGYTATATKACGIVSNYAATTTTTTVTTGGFTAGVASTSNPKVSVAANVFVVGDIIQISGANNVSNNGIFEVLSNAAGILTIRGVGIAGLTYDLFQTQFVTDSTVAGSIYKININALYMAGTSTRKLTGSNTSSFSSKIVSSITTSTSTVNAIPTFDDTDGGMSSPSTSIDATLSRPITITTPTRTGSNSYVFTAQGTVNGAGRVYGRINNNAAGNSSAAFFFGKPYVTGTSLTWEFGVDSTVNNTDDFFIRHNKEGSVPMHILEDDTVVFNKVVSVPRIDFSVMSTNIGNNLTLWVSNVTNSLRIGEDYALTSTTVDVDMIPVFSNVAGKMTVDSSTTPANLYRPLYLSTTSSESITIDSNHANCVVAISTANLSSNRASVLFGRSDVGQWLIGTDKDSALGNDFFLSNNDVQVLTIAGTDKLINAVSGFNSTRYDFVASAVNPGGLGTAWSNSADSNRLYIGANKLAYTSEISAGSIAAVSPITNSLVSFSDASPGNVKSPDATVTSTQSLTLTKTSTTEDTLFTLKRVGTNTTGITTQVLPTTDANIIYFNGYQDVSSGIQYYKSGKARWSLVNDCDGSNDLFKIERRNTSNNIVPLLINASDGILQTPLGIQITNTTNTDFLAIGPSITSGNSGTIVAQALVGSLAGFSSISFNGYYGATETRINSSKVRWRIACDQRSTSDVLFVDIYNGSTTSDVLRLSSATTTNTVLSRPFMVSGADSANVVTLLKKDLANNRVYLHLENSGTNGAYGIRFLSGASKWMIGMNSELTTQDFHLYNYTTTEQTFTVSPTTNIMAITSGLSSKRHDFVTVASNPGSTGTMYQVTGQPRPSFGSLGNFLFQPVTTTTTNSWIQISVPSGARYLRVIIIAGGGGGGSTSYTGANGGGCSGGGSGARFTHVYQIDPNCEYWVYVGAGGSGGTTSSTTGGTGGITYFHINHLYVDTVWSSFGFPNLEIGNPSVQLAHPERYTAVVSGGTPGGMTGAQPFGAGGGSGGSMYPLTTVAGPANTGGSTKGANGNPGLVPGQGASGGSVNTGTGGTGGTGGIGYQGGGDGGGGGGYGTSSTSFYGGTTPSTAMLFEYNSNATIGSNPSSSGWGGFGGGIGGGLGAQCVYPLSGGINPATSGSSPGAGGGGAFGSNSSPYNTKSMSGGSGANGIAHIEFI